MKPSLIYNIKTQVNLPTGTYTISGASGDSDGTRGIYMYFTNNGTWRADYYNGLSGMTTPYTGTWESRAPSTPANYEIRLVTNSVTITGVDVTDEGNARTGSTPPYTDTPFVNGGGPYDTGWVPFNKEYFMLVTSYNNAGPSVVSEIDFTVYIRDTTPTFNTISSNIIIRATGS